MHMKYYISTTEFNCGIDLHARQMYVCVMDRQGKKLVHCNIRNNDCEYFLKLVAPYRHDLTVCCECMFGWYWLADACHQAIMFPPIQHEWLRCQPPYQSAQLFHSILGSIMRRCQTVHTALH